MCWTVSARVEVVESPANQHRPATGHLLGCAIRWGGFATVDEQLMKRAIVEFIGPFALCFMGIGSIMLFPNDIVAIALAHGLAIGLCVMAAGHVSGGHFNPAISIAMFATKRLNTEELIAYVVAQLLGAVAASLVLLAAMPKELRDAAHFGIPAVGNGF